MRPRPVTVEDDEEVMELQNHDRPSKRKSNDTRTYSRASSESSCTMRGDSDNESLHDEDFIDLTAAEPKHKSNSRPRLSTPYSLNKGQLAKLSSSYTFHENVVGSHTQNSHGSLQSRKRAHYPASIDPYMQNRGESSKSDSATSHRQQQSRRHVELDAHKYAELHPDAPVEGGRVLVDVDAVEEKLEEEFFAEAVSSRPIAQPRRRVPLRNCPISLPWIKAESIRHRNSTLKAGKTVELQGGQFLFIIDVIQNLESDVIKLRGWQLKRCSDMHGLLRRGLNELCFIYDVELDDHRSAHEQSMIETELSDVVKVRELIRTNYPFPYLRFSDPVIVSDDKAENIQFARDNDRLVVRSKYITKYRNRAERLRVLKYPINIVQKCIESLTEEECTEGYHLDPLVKRFLWREETLLGGSGEKQVYDNPESGKQGQSSSRSRSSTKVNNSEEFRCPGCYKKFHDVEVLFEHYQKAHQRQGKASQDVNDGYLGSQANTSSHSPCSRSSAGARHTTAGTRTQSSRTESLYDEVDRMASELNLSSTKRQRMYTFGDAFCGAGGTTRGALMAGLLIQWGLDKDSNSGKTWRANFPNAKHYEMWAHEFVALDEPSQRIIVDVLHLSPPCQVWSPVHTVPGKDDEQNFSSLFACEEVLKKTRPRIVTLEQTFGILHPKFSNAFNSLIQIFTFYGYSISWQLVELQRWGLPQRRHRLIILAAGPGDTLPEVPRYTHSENPGPGLKLLKSVNSALSSIPPNAPHHDVAGMLARRTFKAPWDGSGIASCITCNGGEKGHPSGYRNFTICELAVLQTFPLCHQFLGNAIRKQIGNAVPPLIAKNLYRAIIKHLEKTDGVVRDVQDID